MLTEQLIGLDAARVRLLGNNRRFTVPDRKVGILTLKVAPELGGELVQVGAQKLSGS